MEETKETTAAEVTPVEAATNPKSVDEIIAGLMGVGIEEFHEPIKIPFKGRDVEVKLANIPSEEERSSMVAMGDAKGFLWMQGVKLEILSRAITWIDGLDVQAIRALPEDQQYVKDPYDGVQKKIQVVLKNLLDRWGQETVQVLWKILMVHAQGVEDRLVEKLPDAAIMTEVERRLFEQARKEIAEVQEQVIRERTEELLDDTTEDVT